MVGAQHEHDPTNEADLLDDFGIELARMVLVYPDRTGAEMLAVLREHVWLRDWKPKSRQTPKKARKR